MSIYLILYNRFFYSLNVTNNFLSLQAPVLNCSNFLIFAPQSKLHVWFMRIQNNYQVQHHNTPFRLKADVSRLINQSNSRVLSPSMMTVTIWKVHVLQNIKSFVLLRQWTSFSLFDNDSRVKKPWGQKYHLLLSSPRLHNQKYTLYTLWKIRKEICKKICPRDSKNSLTLQRSR